jgi:hypothetical protein
MPNLKQLVKCSRARLMYVVFPFEMGYPERRRRLGICFAEVTRVEMLLEWAEGG